MATETPTRSSPGSGPPPERPAGGRDLRMGRDRPVGGFELWAWLFMRISGIVLMFLAVGHVLIMHIPSGGVGRVNFAFVAVRWQSPFWRTWDWMLLTLALIHGINGLRNITLDYVRRPGLRFAGNMFFYTLGFALFILGTVIVLTFNPAKWPGSV
jgi:succinate dehydrogenase / fumarate reductase, membrane anchor subunit